MERWEYCICQLDDKGKSPRWLIWQPDRNPPKVVENSTFGLAKGSIPWYTSELFLSFCLASMGKDRWELVGVAGGAHYFKRPVQ